MMMYDNSGDEYNVGYDSLSEKNNQIDEIANNAPHSSSSVSIMRQ